MIKKKSKGPDFKKGNKMWLLYKNFDNKKPSKKLDHIKLGLFEVLKKIIKVIFKLNLSPK